MIALISHAFKTSFWAIIATILNRIGRFFNWLSKQCFRLAKLAFAKSVGNYKKLPADFRKDFEEKKGLTPSQKLQLL